MRDKQKTAAEHPSGRLQARVFEGPLSWGGLHPLSTQWFTHSAIDFRVNIDPVHWLLVSPLETRTASHLASHLENAATALQVQELSWTATNASPNLVGCQTAIRPPIAA
jgi:hypothetical protein